MNHTRILVLLLLPALALGYPMTPDKGASPGERCTDENDDFSEYRYPERIAYCERNVSNSRKRTIYDRYHIPQAERTEYTIDHIIPLSIGGDNEETNLWPEHKRVKALRPHLEEQLYRALRDGKMSQDDAVEKVLEAKFHPGDGDDDIDVDGDGEGEGDGTAAGDRVSFPPAPLNSDSSRHAAFQR